MELKLIRRCLFYIPNTLEGILNYNFVVSLWLNRCYHIFRNIISIIWSNTSFYCINLNWTCHPSRLGQFWMHETLSLAVVLIFGSRNITWSIKIRQVIVTNIWEYDRQLLSNTMCNVKQQLIWSSVYIWHICIYPRYGWHLHSQKTPFNTHFA